MLILQGVLTLGRRVRLIEEDMLQIQRDLNKRYEKAEFQALVKSWAATASTGERNAKLLEVAAEVLPKHGFEKSLAGLEEFNELARGFQRFPAFAELWTKSQILLGL